MTENVQNPPEEFESNENATIQKVDSDENIFKTTEKISALDIAWNFEDASADAALTEYKKYGLRYKDLASLEEKDLELMGIKSEEVRARMIHDFKHLPNQEPGFEEVLSKTDMDEYSSNVLSNISEHINNLKTALLVAQTKFNVNPPEDVLILDEKIYGSDLVLKTIDKMMHHCDEIHYMVEEMVSEKLDTVQKSPGTCTKIVKSIFWIGAVIATSYAGVKFIRGKFK
uniref:CSON011160 protein n=1 Tax=Culicoides sonorensis TaxID=179676 RepID=A0A336M325_CULSO